jgi:hypothetical protein
MGPVDGSFKQQNPTHTSLNDKWDRYTGLYSKNVQRRWTSGMVPSGHWPCFSVILSYLSPAVGFIFRLLPGASGLQASFFQR